MIKTTSLYFARNKNKILLYTVTPRTVFRYCSACVVQTDTYRYYERLSQHRYVNNLEHCGSKDGTSATCFSGLCQRLGIEILCGFLRSTDACLKHCTVPMVKIVTKR